MKSAKLQVIIRLTSTGAKVDEVDIANDFPIDQAKELYVALAKEIFAIAYPVLNNTPSSKRRKSKNK